jgi:pimeloyl-ACP methyl ester carboxylesterase
MDRYIPFEQLHDYIIPLLPTNIPLVLLGESYSGPVAISLSTRPELNIHGLILVATFAKYPSSLLKIVSNVLPLSLIFRLPLPDFIIRHYCFGDVGNKKIRDALRESVRENKARRAKGDGSIYKSLLLLILSKHIC